ncbi:integrase [Pelomonas sp. Root662]|nr:integrase [Pelomonas sp. Root405]KRA77397.1 integrase [Pelomonas sp. Root662]
MIELRPKFALPALLRAAGLPRSTFYYQQAALAAEDKYAATKDLIKSVYDQHKGRYGYRRITATLRRLGTVINHKTVQRLMDELQLKSIVRPKKYRSYRGQVGKVAPNVLERNFSASGPNQKWATDVTEFKVDGKKLYLSPVVDLFNGEIVAYATSRSPLFTMVGAMLNRAFAKLRPGDRPVLHSDQGWQYQMEQYRQRLSANAVTQSMSRKGNCLDNAVVESFFGTLKSEYFHVNKFSSLDELEAGLRGYIRYYNHDRIRCGLRGMSPVEYRQLAAGA